MKKDWDKRLVQLEQRKKALFGKQFFEKWLQTNYPNFNGDYWTLQDIAPEELKVECLLWSLEQLQASRNN